jgi:hypothetical protein
VPSPILDEFSMARFAKMSAGETVCIKLSAAHDLPYPFSVSPAFVCRVVAEIHAAHTGLKIVLIEGGVGAVDLHAVAVKRGLAATPHAVFVDAEASESVFVPNPSIARYQADGFWLPELWVSAGARILLTTCKVRSHHFQRWYSGGTRNLIGLLPRARYRVPSSRRAMRGVLHQRGMDAMVADLYATAGRNLLTILDARLLARQDEHLPLRFTRSIGEVLVDQDPYCADLKMVKTIALPFMPPYLTMIGKAENRDRAAVPVLNTLMEQP